MIVALLTPRSRPSIVTASRSITGHLDGGRDFSVMAAVSEVVVRRPRRSDSSGLLFGRGQQ